MLIIFGVSLVDHCDWLVQLEQVKGNLRDVIRSQKLTADTRMMVARASAVLDASSQTQFQCAHRELMCRKRYGLHSTNQILI